MKKASMILSILIFVMWTIYGVAIMIRQSFTMTDFIVTWVGLIMMASGNMMISIMEYKEDR